MSAAAYYRGGARVVIAGVPIRLARKPSKVDLADMRETEKQREKVGSARYWMKPAERRKYDREQASADVSTYAAALGITRRQAFRRIITHRRAIESTPVLDLSLEYDL